MIGLRTIDACLKSATDAFDRELALAAQVGTLRGQMQTALLYLKLNNPMAAQATLVNALGDDA